MLKKSAFFDFFNRHRKLDFDGREFVGRDALMEQKTAGPRYLRRSFAMNSDEKPAAATELHATVDGETRVIGKVTCSSWSWGLERMIGSASIERRHAGLEEAWIRSGNERVEVELSRGALIDLERRTEVPARIHETGVE